MNRLSHIGVSMLLATSAFSVGAQEVVDRVSQETDKCLNPVTIAIKSNCALKGYSSLGPGSRVNDARLMAGKRESMTNFLNNITPILTVENDESSHLNHIGAKVGRATFRIKQSYGNIQFELRYNF